MQIVRGNTLRRKKKAGICIAHSCNCKVTKKRLKKRIYLCFRHEAARRRETNPVSYFFNKLRCNARRRGKEFLLTLEEFKIFCEKTGYITKKGKMANELSIDRINENGPYAIGNIQVLPKSLNSKKYHYYQGHKVSVAAPEIDVSDWMNKKQENWDTDLHF